MGDGGTYYGDLVVRSSIPGLQNKGAKSPVVLPAITLEWIEDQYPRDYWTRVYIDGSATDAVSNGGSAVIQMEEASTWFQQEETSA